MSVDSNSIVKPLTTGPRDGERFDVLIRARKDELGFEAADAEFVVLIDSDGRRPRDDGRVSQIGAQEEAKSAALTPHGAVHGDREGRLSIEIGQRERIPNATAVVVVVVVGGGQLTVLTVGINDAPRTLDQIEGRGEVQFVLPVSPAAALERGSGEPILRGERRAQTAGEGDGNGNVRPVRPQSRRRRDRHDRPFDLQDFAFGGSFAVNGQIRPVRPGLLYGSALKDHGTAFQPQRNGQTGQALRFPFRGRFGGQNRVPGQIFQVNHGVVSERVGFGEGEEDVEIALHGRVMRRKT